MAPLIGHERQQKEMRCALDAGRFHHAWLLAGKRGVGKASFAHWAADWLLNDAAPPSAGNISALLAAGTHPDCRVIERIAKDDGKQESGADAALKRNIAIDQIREMQTMLVTRPSLSDRRVIILDSIDDLERSASNALLKSLEEPPQGTLFLLVSHAPDRLLPTIRSRCRTLRFEPLHDEEMRHVLRVQKPEITDSELETLVKAGRGAPGEALSMAGLGMDELDREAHAIINGGDPDFALRGELARKLALKSAHDRYSAFIQHVPSIIAQLARHRPAQEANRLVAAWKLAQDIGARAQILNHDKQAVVLEMCRLLASLDGHKAISHS